MDTHKDLLDAPLETPLGQYQKSESSTLNTLDFGINALLTGIALFLGIGGVFSTEILFLCLLALLVLGPYQMLSSLIGAIRGNRKKLTYFLLATLYLLFLWVGIDALERATPPAFNSLVAGFFVGLIPLVGAIYYTKLCYDANKA